MDPKRNLVKPGERFVSFRAPIRLVEDYRRALARDERTVSQDLRRYMAERVEQEAA